MKTTADFLNAGKEDGETCPISVTNTYWMGKLSAVFSELNDLRAKTAPKKRGRPAKKKRALRSRMETS
jgi:hypothetical protein